MLGAVAVTFLVQRFAPEAKGRGVPEVIDAIYCKGGRIRPAVAATKALASSISIGTGGAVVRGGRIIQIGSAMIIVVSVAYYVRQFLTADTSYTFKLSQRRHPVPVSGDSSVHAVQGRDFLDPPSCGWVTRRTWLRSAAASPGSAGRRPMCSCSRPIGTYAQSFPRAATTA